MRWALCFTFLAVPMIATGDDVRVVVREAKPSRGHPLRDLIHRMTAPKPASNPATVSIDAKALAALLGVPAIPPPDLLSLPPAPPAAPPPPATPRLRIVIEK